MRQLEQELTAHATALRALARALVGEQQADDLVQDTALQVLANPPPRPTGLRGWLMTVLRHRASKWRRGDRRRQQRERQAPPAEGVATPLRVAEHKETLQQLTAALTALPEPYASALVLRFFEGLLPSAIAARLGVPLPTVKSRLQRGLVLLRQELGARDPDWRAGFTGVFGTGAMQVAAATTGVLLMGTGVKVAASAAVIAAAVLLWLTVAEPAGAPGKVRTDAVGSELLVADVDRAAPASGAEAGAGKSTSRTQVEGASLRAVIRGRVVDEDSRPLAGCAVRLRAERVTWAGQDHVRDHDGWLRLRDRIREESDWLQTHGAVEERKLVTGGDGLFEFAVAPTPLNLSLALHRDRIDGRVGLKPMRTAQTQDVGDVTVPCTCYVRVRVADRNGVAPETPPLTIRETGSRSGSGPRFYASDVVRSEGQGVFTAALVAGSYQCAVGHKVERGEELVVPPGLTACEHAIVVAPLAKEVLAGIVVDERQLPIQGVDVSGWNGEGYAQARTDPAGRFTLYRPESGGPQAQVRLDHDGYEPFCSRTDFRFGGPELRLVLRDLLAVEVHAVAAADDKAVEDFLVRCWWDPSATPDVFKNEGSPRANGHHPGGLATLTGWERGDHLLVVEPLRWDLWRSTPQPVRVAVPGPTRVDVRLGPAADRLLRVVRADGTRCADVAVEVAEADAGLAPGAQTCSLERWEPRDAERIALVQKTDTDARGEALLHGPADRAVTLRITDKGSRQLIVTPVLLREPETLVVTMPEPAGLVVHVRPQAMVRELRAACGLPADGPAPKASRHQPGFRVYSAAVVRRQEEPASLIDGDGTVRFTDLPAGDWLLGLESYDEVGRKVHSWQFPVMVARVTLRAGVITELDLDLGSWLPGEIEGTVTCNGELAADVPIAIEIERTSTEYPLPQRWLRNARTDAQGRFRLRTREGTLRVSVNRTAQMRDVSARVHSYQLVFADREVWLPAGGRLVETFAITATTVCLRLCDSRGEPVAGVPLTLVGPSWWLEHHTIASDADGRIRCELEPLTFTAQVLPRRLQSDAAQRQYLREHPGQRDALGAARLSLGQVTVTRSEAPEVELRLPDEWHR